MKLFKLLQKNLEESYTGTFTVEYLTGDTFSNQVTVSFNGENNIKVTAMTIIILQEVVELMKKVIRITFNDANQWTANFNWNLILSGEYNYLINGNELLISANKNNVGFYKYALRKE